MRGRGGEAGIQLCANSPSLRRQKKKKKEAKLGEGKGYWEKSLLIFFLVIIFLIVVFLLGPTSYIFSNSIKTLGFLSSNYIDMSLTTGTEISLDWSVFYWAWWYALAPMVGTFLVNISNNRTLREVVDEIQSRELNDYVYTYQMLIDSIGTPDESNFTDVFLFLDEDQSSNLSTFFAYGILEEDYNINLPNNINRYFFYLSFRPR